MHSSHVLPALALSRSPGISTLPLVPTGRITPTIVVAAKKYEINSSYVMGPSWGYVQPPVVIVQSESTLRRPKSYLLSNSLENMV